MSKVPLSDELDRINVRGNDEDQNSQDYGFLSGVHLFYIR